MGALVSEELRPSTLNVALKLLGDAFTFQILSRNRHLDRPERRVCFISVWEIMLQHCRTPEHNPVDTGCKGRFSFSRSADLAGNPESRVVAIEFSKKAP